jgi:hypothetical protein
MNEIKPLAWLNDPALKEEVVLRMKKHRAEDSIIQGHYQLYDSSLATEFKGCLLGCTLPLSVTRERLFHPLHRGTWHSKVEKAYGIPLPVCYLLETVFESLDTFEEAAEFAVESIEAIPVGADLSQVNEYWRREIRDKSYWNAREQRSKVLDFLRNAPVPRSP